MDIRQLKYFVQIVDSRSFTRAAEKLRISQPAVGQQVRNLEDELKVTLLVRHSRGVEPTREGEVLYRQSMKILDDIARIGQVVRDCADEVSGTVRLGMAPSLSLLMSEPLMKLAGSRLPKVELQLIEATSPMLKQWVAVGEIDMAMGCEGEPLADVREQSILSEALYLVSKGKPASSLEDEPIPFRALVDRTILIADPMRAGLVQAKIKAASLSTGCDVQIAAIHPSVETVKRMVEDGHGDTILSWSAIRREYRQGRLSAERIVEPDMMRHALLFGHRGRPFTLAQNEIVKLINNVLQDERETAPPSALVGWQVIPA